MSELPPIVEEADLILARLAKVDLASVQHVHNCLVETDTPDEVAKLAHAQARLSRSCRQVLACLSRLKAARATAEREAETHERWRRSQPQWKTDDEIAAETRAEHLDDAMSRVIGHVAQGDTERHTRLYHRFDRELDDWYEQPDFLTEDFDVQLRRACRVLDIPEHLADRYHTLPKPAFTPDPEVRQDEAEDEHEDWAERADAHPHDAAARPPPIPDTG